MSGSSALDDPAHCACFNLRKAARAVTQLYDDALRPSGLRSTQFTVLQHLSDAGPFTMSDLADALVTDRTTLTRNLKPLIDKGLVQTTVGDDRRQRSIAITDAGNDALRKALPLWRQAQTRVVAGLATDRWNGMMADLGDVVRLTQVD